MCVYGLIKELQSNPFITTWFVRHLVYSVRYSMVQIHSLLLTMTSYSSVMTALVYNDTKYSVPFMALKPEFDCILTL
jgi:hypothetical protein